MDTVRVSRIEAFRRVLLGWGDESALRRDMAGNPDEPNWMMEAGTAFHQLLDDGLKYPPCDGDDYPIERNGWTFAASAINRVTHHQGPGLREVTARGQVGPLMVQGTCDHIRGRVIRDTKTKFSPIDAKAYEQSLQWRYYLLLHDADCFAYDLCAFRESNRRLELLDIVTVRFWRYHGLERDCVQWANRFADWASQLNERAA